MITKTTPPWGVQHLEFEIFSECPRLIHGVFLRHGGESSGDFASLNFSISMGDDKERVRINTERSLAALQLNHTSKLYQEHKGRIINPKPGIIERGDALITSEPKQGLLIMHADCQAIILYDPLKHALANIHCGWRGNVVNIVKNAVDALRDHFGSLPQNLLAAVSPSLGPQYSEFINYKSELPSKFLPYQFKPNYFNLWEITRDQLIETGILPNHIQIAELCTYENEEDFFSYRRKKRSGRHATIAALL